MSEGTLLMSRPEASTLIRRIRTGMENVRVALLDLEEREGWRAMGYESWVVCVQKEFGQSASQIYRLLNAAEIDRILHSPIGEEIPESHARELVPLKSDPEAVREVYAEAGPKPTAVRIRTAVEKRRPDAKPKGKPQKTPQSWDGKEEWELDPALQNEGGWHDDEWMNAPMGSIPDSDDDGGTTRRAASDTHSSSALSRGLEVAARVRIDSEEVTNPPASSQSGPSSPEIAVEYNGYIAALAFDQPDPMGFVKALQPGFLRQVRDNIGPAIAWLQRVEAYL